MVRDTARLEEVIDRLLVTPRAPFFGRVTILEAPLGLVHRKVRHRETDHRRLCLRLARLPCDFGALAASFGAGVEGVDV